jgi:glycosyltransferase involved in cell wall biosynthesis
MYPSMFPQWLGKRILYGVAITWHRLIGSYNLVDKFIFPSGFARNYYLNNSGVKKAKSVVIPHYVEIFKKRPVSKDTYLLFVGRLSKEKGIEDLLEAFKYIMDTKLIVIGGGRIPRKRVIEYMASAEAVVIPSRINEVLPMVVLEAFSCGTPVLVPKIGVFKQLVKEGRTGYFYKYKNVSDLQRKIKILIKKGTSEKMRKNILHKANLYSKDHYESLLKAYKTTSI